MLSHTVRQENFPEELNRTFGKLDVEKLKASADLLDWITGRM